MNHTLLPNWKKQKGYQAEWEAFLDSDAAEAGFKLVEALSVPAHNVIGDDVFKVAQRHAFCAGIHYAMQCLRNLPYLHTKGVKDQLGEWDHIGADYNEQHNSP